MAASESEPGRVQLSWEGNAAPAQPAPQPEPETPSQPRSELLSLPSDPPLSDELRKVPLSQAGDAFREKAAPPDAERESPRLAQVFGEGPVGSNPRGWGGRRPSSTIRPATGRRARRRPDAETDEIVADFDRLMNEDQAALGKPGRRSWARVLTIVGVVAAGAILLLWAAIAGLRELGVGKSISSLIVVAVALAGGGLLMKRARRPRE